MTKREDERKMFAGAVRVEKEFRMHGFSPSQDYVFNTASKAKELAKMNAEKIFNKHIDEKVKEWEEEGLPPSEIKEKAERYWKRTLLKQKGRAEALSSKADWKTQVSIFAGEPKGQEIYGKYEALREKGEEIFKEKGLDEDDTDTDK